MSETVTNLKVRFGADTKNFKADLESGKAAVDKFSSSAKDSFSQFAAVFGVNIGAIQSSLKTAQGSLNVLSAGFKGAAASGLTFSGVLKVIKLALISTGIGALVVAFGALITFFTRFSDGVGKVKPILAGIGAATDVLLDRFGKVGKSIYQVFTGDFKGAGESIKQAFTGFTDELSKEVSLAIKLKKEIGALAKDSKMFEAERESGYTKILQLREKAKDIDLSPATRLAAVKEANAIEEKLAEKSIDLAEREVAATLDQIDAKKGKLKLDQQALELIEKIKDGTISADDAQKEVGKLAMSDKDLKGKLFEVVDKIVNREKEQQNIVQTRLRLQKSENTLRKEIMSQEIEAIKAVAELKEQQAKNEKKTVLERSKLILEASELQKKALRIDFDANNISKEKYLAELDKLAIETEEKIKAIREKLNPKMETLSAIKLTVDDKTGKIAQTEIPAPKIGELETSKLEAKAAKIQSIYGDLKTTVTDFAQTFNDSMSGIASTFGESLGEMLAGTGTLGDIGKVVLSSLADLAIQVGKIAIGVGIATLGIKKALMSLNPFVAIAAGVALVALGSYAKSALSSAGSGTYSSASTGTSYDTGTTSTSTIRSAPQTIYITGEFRQRGTDLVAVIDKNTQRRVIGT